MARTSEEQGIIVVVFLVTCSFDRIVPQSSWWRALEKSQEQERNGKNHVADCDEPEEDTTLRISSGLDGEQEADDCDFAFMQESAFR